MKLKLLLALLLFPFVAFGANTNVYDNVLIRNSFQFIGGSPGPGKVLTSDAFGYTSWTTPAAGGAQTNAVNNWVAEQYFVTPLTGFEPHGAIVTNTTTSSSGGFSGRGVNIQTMILNNNGHYVEQSLNSTGTSTLTYDGFNALSATLGAQTVGAGMSTIGIGGAATVISLGTTSAASVTFNGATASIPNSLDFGSGVLNLNNISGVVSNTGGLVSTGSVTGTNFVWTLGTPGSVLFTGTGGNVSQNNSNFFWDNTNTRLGLGTNAPAFPLDVVGTIRSISATIGVVDSTPNSVLLLAANGGAGTITNSAISSIFTGSIDAPTNTAPFITQTSVPSAINVVVQNANYRTFVNASINLTTAVAGMAQASLVTALSGTTSTVSVVSAPAGAIATYIMPVTGFIQPNATYWVTNQSTGTATATFNVSRSNAL